MPCIRMSGSHAHIPAVEPPAPAGAAPPTPAGGDTCIASMVADAATSSGASLDLTSDAASAAAAAVGPIGGSPMLRDTAPRPRPAVHSGGDGRDGTDRSAARRATGCSRGKEPTPTPLSPHHLHSATAGSWWPQAAGEAGRRGAAGARAGSSGVGWRRARALLGSGAGGACRSSSCVCAVAAPCSRGAPGAHRGLARISQFRASQVRGIVEDWADPTMLENYV